MSKLLYWGTFGLASLAMSAASLLTPRLLSDKHNSFIAGFVGFEMLSFLGVVVTITLASAANLHLELNKLEDATGREFPRTRASIRLSSYSLIGALALAVVILACKPFVPRHPPQATAFCNSAAVLVVMFSLLVLVDLTRTVLKIPSLKSLNGKAAPKDE